MFQHRRPHAFQEGENGFISTPNLPLTCTTFRKNGYSKAPIACDSLVDASFRLFDMFFSLAVYFDEFSAVLSFMKVP